MRRFIAAAVVLAALNSSAPARALVSSGCSVATVGGEPTSCRFRAIGPVTFVASTTSGWRIMRSRDDGLSWTEAARSAPNEVRPTHVNVTVSRLPAVKVWDLIDISIVRANENTPVGVVSYQHGSITATSDL